MMDKTGSRIPTPLITGILLVCALPFVLTLLGMDFGSHFSVVDYSWAMQAPRHEVIDAQFQALSGAFTHTLLEWSAFCVAAFVAFLAFSHYKITHDVTVPIIGVVFFMAGCMDVLHTLAADRLIHAVADDNDLVPFTWAIARFFSALLMILGVGILLLRKQEASKKPRFGFVIGVSLIFGIVAYVIIHVSATAAQLPQTTFPDAFLTRPYDAIPLVLFVFAGLVVYPRLYRRHPSLFTHALVISAIPEVITQLHMSFGSTALFDSHFNIAHFMKVVAYTVPLIGLMLDYIRAQQALQLNIAEHLQMEKALQTSEAHQRTILETVADAIITIDGKGSIQTFNPTAEKIFGYPANDVIGNNVSMLLPDQEQNEHENYTAKSRLHAPRIINQDRELQGQRKDRSLFPLELNVAPMELEGQRRFVGVLRDITERKNNESRLQKATDEANAASRAKSDFLATMSHEIRTPMNAILGILGLLKDTPLDEQQKQLVQVGRGSGELLLTIINDILDFSKMEADKLQLEHTDFDLHHLLTQSVGLLKPQADRKGLTLAVSLEQDLPHDANGDPDRLRQILVNLINNAIKFTPRGSITVSASVDSTQGDAFILRCAVQDTGIGIPKEHQATLFDEFTMADQSHTRHHEGTGLGLAICKRLVLLMHGSINVTSTPGNGSTFCFTATLAPSTEQASNNDPARDKPQQYPLNSTRILLVEDNPANQIVVKSILQYAKLQVDIADNGREAIEAVRNLPYDIVLMDISMPEMDGMTATREIRQLPGRLGRLPIIALTAHALSGDRQRFLDAGMNDYLSKPIDRAAMLHCIAHWTAITPQNPQADSITTQADTSPADTGDKILTPDMISSVEPFVDEDVLQQLVHNTAPDIALELLALYIEDARKRVEHIQETITKHDIKTLELKSHALSSLAAAHGNAKLHSLARKVEHLCQEGKHEQALLEAVSLSSVANESLHLLAKRVDKGFTTEEKR